MIHLFEYQNNAPYTGDLEELEIFLDEIWNNREKNPFYYDDAEDKIEVQRFLQIIHRSSELKSNQYAGVIHFENQRINLLPKIFYDEDMDYSEDHISAIHLHVLWWLSYCRKIKFPNYSTSLSGTKSDFLEVLIYLFSRFTRQLLSSSIFQQYEEISREVSFIKGRLNTNAYIRNNMSRGNWHKLNCTYDAFEMDNEFNRIIKYVATLLRKITTSSDSKKHLDEILFILDGVTYEKATSDQCDRITFNPMFADFEIVRDYCQLFLSHSISFHYKDELKLFAFLLPMEYIFEDFIFGFIDRELNEIAARAQRRDVYLDEDRIFNLQPDLYLMTPHGSLIADTKYKIAYSDENDPKKGISQNDLYQMVAYAIRFGVDEVVLFYPDTIQNTQDSIARLIIRDVIAEGKSIEINAYQLPIVHRSLFQKSESGSYPFKRSLEETFADAVENLKKRIREILMPMVTQNSSYTSLSHSRLP